MSNLQSPTKLTEFAPLSPEGRQPGVGFLLSKFFKIKRGSSQETSPSIPKVASKTSIPDDPHTLKSDSSSKTDVTSSNWEENQNKAEGGRSSRSSSITSQPMPALVGDGRSLPNVLKRISNLLAMKPTNLQAYEDTEFKQYWMPDSVSKECYECGEKFTTFRRRHHCRVCGQIFCSRCCNQEIPGKIIGCTGDLRVCTYCCKIVLTYLQSSDSGADLSADLRAVQEDLQTKLGLGEGGNTAVLLEPSTPGAVPSEGVRGSSNFSNVPLTPSLGGSHTSSHHHHHHSTGSTRRKTSVGYQEERYPSSRNSEENLSRGMVSHGSGKSKAHLVAMRHIIDEMWRTMSLGSHRYHLRTFQSCTAGSEVVDWLLSHGIVSSRVQAVATAQSLMEAGFLECVSHPEERNFLEEYALYRPRHIPPLLAPTSLSTSSPSSLSSSSSSSSNQQQGEAPQLCPSSSSSSVPSSSPSGSELSPGQVCPGESQEPNWVKQIAQKGDWNIEESNKADMEERDMGGRLPSSSSSFYLDLNVQENKVTLSRPKREESQGSNGKEEFATTKKRVTHHSGDPTLNGNQHVFCLGEGPNFLCVPHGQFAADAVVASPPHGWHSVDIKHLNHENGELEAFQRLSVAYKSHQEALLRQLLVSEGLAQSWGEVVLPLVSQIVELVRPDVRSDLYEMDIRQYVQFKKVPGGSRSESGIISGVVCTKNIAHRAMAARLTNPRILLLGCSVAYQRVEGRFLSLEPLMMQEYDYLKNAVARIAALQPDLLLVEKNVSRLAQDFLLDLGVTLVTNLKVSVLDRVAHCTRSDVVGSVDAHVGRPRLGTCRAFYLKTFDLTPSGGECIANLRPNQSNQLSTTKTLMFFDGCPAHLGCTVILRGATKPELARLKRVVSRMVFIHYSWHLEKSFLMDEFAMPPAPLPDSELFGDPLNLSDTSPENNQNYERGDVICKEDNSEEMRNKVSFEKKQAGGSRSGIKEKPLEDRKIVAAETVSDFSDPLHSYLSVGSTSDAGVSTAAKDSEVPTITVHPEIEDDADEVFSAAKLSVASNPRESNRFRKALDDIVLSSSPFLRQSIPYLDTEAGRNCPLRKYFPSEIYWSAQFENNRGCSLGEEPVTCTTIEPQVERTAPPTRMKSNHPFLTAKLTGSINSEAVQALLANFRACGGHITPYRGEYDEDNTSVEKKETDQEKVGSTCKAGIADIPRESIGEAHDSTGHWPVKVDALDPFNHQCLPVLLCSYSPSSNNAPYFCVNPWVCPMEFYGHYDIPLGKFLERYCFSSSYLCPSETCDVPMLSHIRRFVHGGGCVQLALKELDNSIPSMYPIGSAKENGESSGSSFIVTWSWCQECKTASPVVPLTQESWSMSFAKYLELRYHGYVYTRRGQNACSHSLHHDHYQYFGMEKMVASFKYTKISPWEISLPQSQIVPRHSLPQWNGGGSFGEGGTAVEENIRHQTSAVVEEIKTLALKGHEVFSAVREKLLALAPEMEAGSPLMSQLQKDQAHFKSKIEQIQLKLTSPTLESKKLEASQGAAVAKEVNDLMLKIEDCVIQVKRLIAETVSDWNARLSELAAAKKKEEKARRSIEAASNSGKAALPLVPSTESMSQHKASEENAVLLSNGINGNSGPSDGIETDESIEADENLEVLKNQDVDSTIDNDSTASSLLMNSSSPHENKESLGETSSVPSNRFVASTPLASETGAKKSSECLDDSNEVIISSSEAEANDAQENGHCCGNQYGLKIPSSSFSSFTSPNAEGLEAGLGVNRAWADEHEFVLIHHNEVPANEDLDSCPGKESKETSGNKTDTASGTNSVLGHGRSKSEGDGRCRPPIPPLSAPPSPAPPIHSMSADEQTVTATTINLVSNEKKTSGQSGTVKNILSQLLPSNPIFTPIQCPLNPGEHHLLPLGVSGIPVVVYESEPSSVIAYALSSSEYRRCIQEMTGVGPRRYPWQTANNTASSTHSQSDCEDGVCTTPTNKRNSNSGSGRSSNSSGVNNSNSSTGMTPSSVTSQASRSSSSGNGTGIGSAESESGQDGVSSQDAEAVLTGSVPPQLQQQSQIEVQFNDSSAHFYCRVYFAEQFLALRQHVLPDGEEGYVRSLSRCISWTARGGKSGSSFYKTKDDRFILKDMSRLEVQIFLNFAPGYFDYMRRTSEHCNASQSADQNASSPVPPPPTLLGKIIGVYRVAFRNTGTTGATLRTNLLVMENLFYGRGSRVTQRFDLKGSMRNRLVDAAASSSSSLHSGAHGGMSGANGGMSNVTDSEIVLLDENLLKMTCESPLYIQSHSKTVLTRAINNDTLFLASQSVMDYSLLVGLDEEKKELIVGIIDYIRTFTWDKRLENMVKSAGILGGQGKSPTVVAPELYRGRFIAAMHRYFLPVPDQWTGLGIGIDC